MGLQEEYRRVSNLRQYMKKRRNDEHLDKSKDMIKDLITKKMTTCFIGSIDSVESSFGKYWGKDIDRRKRTPQQMQIFQLWMQLRSDILDKGNVQLRSMIKELDNYHVDYQGENTSFNNEVE